MVRAVSVILLVAALLAGCRDAGQGPWELSGRVFIFNYRVATATYVVTLRPLDPSRRGARAIAEFEDPAGGPAIIVEAVLWPGAEKLALESPPVFCIRKDRPYAVVIRIMAEDGAELQRLSTDVVSTLDQDVLPDRPLVVGPVYTPNPELAGHADGHLPGARASACPPRDG
ncbi:MAG: hypothetical protein WAT70_08200 [Rhizobiaceae bacterium]